MKANKSLGQHFLVNQGVIEKIVFQVESFLQNKPVEWVCEIGPGPGAITDRLLDNGVNVLAVDVDSRMVDRLEEKHQEKIKRGQFKIFRQDASKESFQELLKEYACSSVCGNLPYNVGTEIVISLYENAPQIQNFCFMLQKEVVDRFLGVFQTKSYSSLSVRWSWGTQLISRFNVKPGSFSPPPEVDSAVFSYRRLIRNGIPAPHSNLELYREYTEILKKAFSLRRKMMRKALPVLKDSSWGALRAEQISPEEFLKLCNFVAQQNFE